MRFALPRSGTVYSEIARLAYASPGFFPHIRCPVQRHCICTDKSVHLHDAVLGLMRLYDFIYTHIERMGDVAGEHTAVLYDDVFVENRIVQAYAVSDG